MSLAVTLGGDAPPEVRTGPAGENPSYLGDSLGWRLVIGIHAENDEGPAVPSSEVLVIETAPWRAEWTGERLRALAQEMERDQVDAPAALRRLADLIQGNSI